MTQVVKRDGEVTEFSLNKIAEATKKTFRATSKDCSNEILELLSLGVTADFQNKMKDREIPVEEIQDSMEYVLERTGCTGVAKACILYRKQREKIRNINSTIPDYKDVVSDYVKMEDWCVKENSAVTYSVGGLILSNSDTMTTNCWFSEIYNQETAETHRNADIHIHDLFMLIGYCAGWSLKRLLMEDSGGIAGKIISSPAEHLSVLCDQMVNFLGIVQNEWAGAQAFSSFDTYLAPFVKAGNLAYPGVKKCIESFIYGVNIPSRWDTQAPFSNITLDWTVLSNMAEMSAIVGGREMDFKYKDCKKEMNMINRTFIETMIEGDANGRGFQYPIPTYSITNEFDWSDTENNRLLFEMTSKYGTPYFSNYINSDIQPSDVHNMCCCLHLDLRELRKKTGRFFGSGESAGSVDAVTVNMSRIAYQAKDEADFCAKLDHMMDMSARSLKTRRQVITELSGQDLYPYTKRYLGTSENYFSTISLIGMNEAGFNARWVGKDLTHRECQEFTKNVLNHMREQLSGYQKLYSDLHNLEAMPAESTTCRLAEHDKQRYPNIITTGAERDTPCYTNNSHFPVDYTGGVFDTLDIQDELQTLYTSGTVFRAFLGGRVPDWRTAANLVRTVAENYKLPCYMLSSTYSIYKCHGYLIGEHSAYSIHGEKTKVYSRVTGYYRPVQNWDEGRTQKYKNRTDYNIGQPQLKHGVSRIVADTREWTNSTRIEASQQEKERGAASARLYLFTTKTCPNRISTKEFLKRRDYQIINAEERPNLAEKFGIVQAPTLVIVSSGIARRFANASNIRRFVEQSHTNTAKA